MPRSDAGYVEPSGSTDLIDLYVQCLNGEGTMLKLSRSCTALEVYRMVSAELPPKKGGKLKLHHLDSPMALHQTLQEQGMLGTTVALSCTYVPTDLYAAWCAVQEVTVSTGELAMQGVTRIEGTTAKGPLHNMPQTVEHLTLGSLVQCLQQLQNYTSLLTCGCCWPNWQKGARSRCVFCAG